VGIGTVTIIYGAVQAIGRRDAREVLAYSAIGHAGYVLVALGLGGRVALAAAALFTVTNALNKALLFLAVDLRGPLVGAAFAVGAFSVAGVPPSAGFFARPPYSTPASRPAALPRCYCCSWAAPSPSSTCSRSTSTPTGGPPRTTIALPEEPGWW